MLELTDDGNFKTKFENQNSKFYHDLPIKSKTILPHFHAVPPGEQGECSNIVLYIGHRLKCVVLGDYAFHVNVCIHGPKPALDPKMYTI